MMMGVVPGAVVRCNRNFPKHGRDLIYSSTKSDIRKRHTSRTDTTNEI